MPAEPSILASIEFQMSLLMFVSLAGYLIAYRINQSAVVGIILAGILVGPSLLGLVTVTDFVSSLAHLGAVVLLFTIGLEFEMKEITNFKYFVIALCGILVPWAGGFLISIAFGFNQAASIFIATALTATSIAITANVLREMGKLQTAAGKAIIGAAVIDDILALLALSVAEGSVGGSLSAASLAVTGGKAVAFVVAGAVIGKLAVSKLVVRIDRTPFARKHPESIFIFAMMVAFLYATGAELVGLSAIIGSFMAGVTLAGVALTQKHIFREGAEHLQIIFASIFFISLGVLLDLHVVSADLLVFVGALTVVAGLTKIIGCGTPARLMGSRWGDSLVIGLGMMPRGEVAMIVALIGLNQNLIEQNTYAALILMSLVTTIIPPILLRNWVYKR